MLDNIKNNKKFYKATVKLSNLYVETDNMTDAYYKSKDGLGPGSYSTHKSLSVTKLLDGTLMLMDGHHRIADKIKYAELNNVEDILNLTFNAIVHDENYANLESVPDGQYWMSFMDWTYNMEEVLIKESEYYHGTALPKSEKNFSDFDKNKGVGVRGNP